MLSKRLGIILLSVGLLVSATACSNQKTGDENAADAQVSDVESLSESSFDDTQGEGSHPILVEPAGPPPVADAAQYRGVVQKLDEDDEGYVLTLSQVEGTDFGAEILQVSILESTTRNFDPATINQGDYVEVFYGRAMGSTEMPESVTAVVANLLPDAALCIYNGTIMELILDEEDPDVGSILLQRINGEDTILFHYTSETQFYLDRSSLDVGDAVNVYSNGITTRSLPPQATALEVRLYPQNNG